MAGLPFNPDIGTSPVGGAIEGFSRGLVKAREASAARSSRVGAVLFEEAKKNPDLWDDPTAAKAIEAYVGGKEPFAVLKGAYQNQEGLAQTYQQAVDLGLVPGAEQQQVAEGMAARQNVQAANAAPPPSAPFRSIARGVLSTVPIVGPTAAGMVPMPETPQQPVPPSPLAQGGYRRRLVEGVQSTPGASLKLGEKGGTSVSVTGPSREQAAEGAFWRAVEENRKEKVASGIGDIAAQLQSIQEVTRAAREAGMPVPKVATDIELAPTTRGLEVSLRRAVKAAERAIEIDTAAQLETQREIGTRSGRTLVPISPDETAAARATSLAEDLGLTPDQTARLTDRFRREAAAAQTGAETEARETASMRTRMGATGAVAPTPDASRTQLGQQQNAMNSLGEVFKLMKPEMLGPAAGRFNNLKAWFGAMGMDEERFRAAIDAFVRDQRKAITGAAAPEKELEDMKLELLNPKQSPPMFFARLATLAKDVQNKHGEIDRTLKANNEVTVPLNIDPKLQRALDAIQPAIAEQTGGAPELPPGWTLEPMDEPQPMKAGRGQ